MKLTDAVGEHSNYAFFGEAGCGKSEIAVNLALALAREKGKPVRFFDLDMTKPLFRARDVAAILTGAGVEVRYQEQFMDAPTQVGGPSVALRDAECYTILDIGGDYIGAGAVGMYAPLLRASDTAAIYVVNPFRPWSAELKHIDGVLSQVLGAAHLPPRKIGPAHGIDPHGAEIEQMVPQRVVAGKEHKIGFQAVVSAVKHLEHRAARMHQILRVAHLQHREYAVFESQFVIAHCQVSSSYASLIFWAVPARRALSETIGWQAASVRLP